MALGGFVLPHCLRDSFLDEGAPNILPTQTRNFTLSCARKREKILFLFGIMHKSFKALGQETASGKSMSWRC